MLNKYEQTLLSAWEDIHKRGLLTLWILLALKEEPRHMADIKQFISRATNNLISADDKSMYRALRRYNSADIVNYRTKPSKNGPDLKVYYLTDTGKKILDLFVERNILPILNNKQVKELTA